MHFLVFIPNAVGADPDLLRRVGLPGLARAGDVQPSFGELLSDSPSGEPGLLVTWMTSSRLAGLVPAKAW